MTFGAEPQERERERSTEKKSDSETSQLAKVSDSEPCSVRHNLCTMGDHGDHDMGHSMGAYFTTEWPSHIIFEYWSIETTQQYHFACIVLFFSAIFSSWLRFYRTHNEASLQHARAQGYDLKQTREAEKDEDKDRRKQITVIIVLK